MGCIFETHVMRTQKRTRAPTRTYSSAPAARAHSSPFQVQLMDKQLGTEKKYDLKMGAHLNRLHEWETKIGQTRRDRFAVMENNWETSGKDLEVFRARLNDSLAKMEKTVGKSASEVHNRMNENDAGLAELTKRLEAVKVETGELRAKDLKLEGALEAIKLELSGFQDVTVATQKSHGVGIETAEKRLGEHQSILDEHGTQLEHLRDDANDHHTQLCIHKDKLETQNKQLQDHEDRTKTLEKDSIKIQKEIRDTKRDLEEKQNYNLTRFEQQQGSLVSLRKLADSTTKRIDEAREVLDPLKEYAEAEAEKLKKLTLKSDGQSENLVNLNKSTQALKTKVTVIDTLTDNIEEVHERINGQDDHLADVVAQVKSVEEKTAECEEKARRAVKDTEKIRMFVDEGLDQVHADHAKQRGAIAKMEQGIKRLHSHIEEVVEQNSGKDKVPEIGKKSGTNMTQEEKKVEYSHYVKALSDICARFEKMVISRKKMCPIAEVQAKELAGNSLEVADYLQNQANLTAVMRFVMLKPGDIPDTNEDISQQEDRVHAYMRDVDEETARSNSTKDALRLEARRVFLSKAHEAIDMAMSRFDQILAPSTGLVSRKGIATCVACDRPLAAKKRAKDLYDTVPADMSYDTLPPPTSPQRTKVSVELRSPGGGAPALPERVAVRPATSQARFGGGGGAGPSPWGGESSTAEFGSKSVTFEPGPSLSSATELPSMLSEDRASEAGQSRASSRSSRPASSGGGKTRPYVMKVSGCARGGVPANLQPPLDSTPSRVK